MAEVVTGQRRPCSRCKGPREDRAQRYCLACRARYMREYRKRQAARRRAAKGVKQDSVSRENGAAA
jgi:hypothetical protein